MLGEDGDTGTRRWDDRVFLGMVAVLPLHTVFVPAWISWKPFLVALVVLLGADAVAGVRDRAWPWQRRVSIAFAVFALAVLPGFPTAPAERERFVQLALALGVGAGVLLASERRLRRPGMIDRALGVVYIGGAAMGVTAFVFSLVAVGTFGAGAIDAVNDLPGVFRVMKPAYLTSGFIALTNWHQDPGYSAAWSVLWSVLALFASLRGRGSGRWWMDGAVIGGLWFAAFMAFSRTGWVSLVVATVLGGLGARRAGWPRAGILRRHVAALAAAGVLVAAVGAADAPGVGGDLDLQLAFRLSQGWDLLADLTGLFEQSEAFADRFDVSEERADVWPEYVAMFGAHPVFGVGLGVGWDELHPSGAPQPRPRAPRRDGARRDDRLPRARRDDRRHGRRGPRRGGARHRLPPVDDPDGPLRADVVVRRRPLPRRSLRRSGR